MYKLNKFAAGRYDVHAENGRHAGSILGGAKSWCAEIGSRTIGCFESKSKAAQAILADKGIKGLFAQMQEIIESPTGLLAHHKEDFYECDRAFLLDWKCAGNLLWVVRKHGTNLIALDLPSTKETGQGVLGAMDPELTGNPWQLYLVDVSTLKVKQVTPETARLLVSDTPKYEVVNDVVTFHGHTIASIDRGMRPGARQLACHVVVDCLAEPGERTLEMIIRAGFFAITTRVFPLQLSADSLEVRFGKESLYLWERKATVS